VKTSICNCTSGLLQKLLFVLMIVSAVTRHGMAADDSQTVQTTGREAKPIQITSQRLVSDTTNNQAEFLGNVRASQGQTLITADSLKLFFVSQSEAGQAEAGQGSMAQSLEKLVATGNVEIKFDNRLAVARQAVYITAQRMLVLTGPGASVTSGDNTITGETITFYRADGRFTVDGGSGGRVKAVIQPEKTGLE
jgi:lipopolysaccharide export system protein LptA